VLCDTAKVHHEAAWSSPTTYAHPCKSLLPAAARATARAMHENGTRRSA
jgi:hypothetical protein